MAKCGIFQRYPVHAVAIGAESAPERAIGTAETLAQAIKLAEQQGLWVCGNGDGGQNRFSLSHAQGQPCFIVTVYSD